MSYKVDNAIIMAAGISSRFAPISHEMPKALIEVRSEVLIERQIRQLRDAGIDDIIIVTGYMHEKFSYLKDRFDVRLVHNAEYATRNNNGSIHAVRDYLCNSYVCSADNYFSENPFETQVDESYYAVVYSDGPTNEWCVSEGSDGYIDNVKIGGKDSWYMLGHTFWDEDFSRAFLSILEDTYHSPRTKASLWESIYMEHLDVLKMKPRKYPDGVIYEFDTLEELRKFDPSYIEDSRSPIMNHLAQALECSEGELVDITPITDTDNHVTGIRFSCRGRVYTLEYNTQKPKEEYT